MVPSIRNAEAGQLHVLNDAKCTKLLHSSEFLANAKTLQEKKTDLDLEILELGPLDELIDKPATHFPYTKVWANSWKEPVIIAHSSGSTGRYSRPLINFG